MRADAYYSISETSNTFRASIKHVNLHASTDSAKVSGSGLTKCQTTHGVSSLSEPTDSRKSFAGASMSSSKQSYSAPAKNNGSFARAGVSSSTRTSKVCGKTDDVCGVCLRLCATLKHEQPETIDSVKRFITNNGIKAAEAKYCVDMCVKCQTGEYVYDSVCGHCEGTELISICAIGHKQFEVASLLIRNDALGESNLFFEGRDRFSWHLVVQPSKPSQLVKAKFDALFGLIKNGQKNRYCVLVNSDQVISQMVQHIPAYDYQRVTPSFCPSHIAAKAAWILLRITLAPLDVSIWPDAFLFHLDRERIRAEAATKIAAGKACFENISRKIYEGVDIGTYLVELVNILIRTCLSSRSRDLIKLQRLCDKIIPELVEQMIIHAQEYDIDVITAESSFADICDVVVSNSLLSCSMFHVIKRIWRQLVLFIHPDKGGNDKDFSNCIDIFNQLEKFLIGANDEALEKYRRSVVVVQKANNEVRQLLEDIKSAPCGYSSAVKTGRSVNVSTVECNDLVVFEEMCDTLVSYGAIDESLASSLKNLHEEIPEEVETLVKSCVSIAATGARVSSTLAMVAIATGSDLKLAPSAQTEVATSYAMEQAPKIFTKVEYPELGATTKDVSNSLSNFNSNEIAIYGEYLNVCQAEKASELVEEMDEEEELLEEVSEDYEEAENNVDYVNWSETSKAITRTKINTVIRKIYRLIYFTNNVTESDRELMLEAVLGVTDCPYEHFISEMEYMHSNKSGGYMLKMLDTVTAIIGTEARENELKKRNLQKSIDGQEAKRLRDITEATKFEEMKSSNGSIQNQVDLEKLHDQHKAEQAAHTKAYEAAMKNIGLAWVRDIKRDETSGKYVIMNMVTGAVSEIPESILVTVYTTAKEKECGKLTGNNRTNQVPIPALLRKIEDRTIPENFYLRPLIIHYTNGKNKDMVIERIDAGTTEFAKKTIVEIRNRMEASDFAKKINKHESHIDEIDASFEHGKGEFVSTFCARRASSSALSRERAERKKQTLIEKTRTIIQVKVATEIQYEDEITGELKDDVVMKTVEEVVVIVPTGSKNFYKLTINSNSGSKSNGHVSLGGRRV